MNSKIGISGSLKFISLGDLMQLIGTNGSTGVLTIKNKYADKPGLVYFVEGKMIDAVAGELTGIKALYSLFGWLDGSFEFSVEKVAKEQVIKESRMEIILNGLSMLDDGVTKKLGPEQYDQDASQDDGKIKLPVIKGPLVDYMYVVDEDTYYDNSSIVEQGKHGGWIWVILEGIVEIRKHTESGSVTILRLGAGSFIGSISTFLMEGAERSATATAIGEVQLGVLDGQLLSKEFSMLTAKLKEVILSLDKRLKTITNSVVDKLSEDNTPICFETKDKVLLNWDDYKEKTCLINEGEAYLAAKIGDRLINLFMLKKDDFIGEIPFLEYSDTAQGLVVYTTNEFQTEEIDMTRVHQEFDRVSVTFKNIIDGMISCISITTNIAIKHIKKQMKEKKTVKNITPKE